jgi:cyclopropane fatty-acyl-phospholipid synthase-like methyltransferase
MGAHLGVNIIEAPADNFRKYFGEMTFDVVASFWMTEYLSPHELKRFVAEGLSVLHDGGLFLTTLIANTGWGKFYQLASRLKKIEKFTYSQQEIHAFFSNKHISIQKVNGKAGIVLGYLVSTQK